MLENSISWKIRKFFGVGFSYYFLSFEISLLNFFMMGLESSISGNIRKNFSRKYKKFFHLSARKFNFLKYNTFFSEKFGLEIFISSIIRTFWFYWEKYKKAMPEQFFNKINKTFFYVKSFEGWAGNWGSPTYR